MPIDPKIIAELRDDVDGAHQQGQHGMYAPVEYIAELLDAAEERDRLREAEKAVGMVHRDALNDSHRETFVARAEVERLRLLLANVMCAMEDAVDETPEEALGDDLVARVTAAFSTPEPSGSIELPPHNDACPPTCPCRDTLGA